MSARVLPICFASGLPYPEGPSFDRAGNLFVCVRRDGYIVRVNVDGSSSPFLTTGHQPNGTRFHRDGRLFVAEIKLCQILEVQPNGTSQVFLDRYRVTPTKEVSRIASGLDDPNGIALSADESAVFVAESRTNRVLRLPVLPDGRTGKLEVFCQLTDGSGPDGMAFGSDGNLYVTNYGGGTIDVVDPNGHIAARLAAGGEGPTNCAFWGTALYVTKDESASV